MDINRVKKDIEKYLGRGCHAWDHTLRVYKLCLHIGRKESADMEVLKYAALLHDIGRGHEDRASGRVCHAAKGAELAGKLLSKYSISDAKKENILHCISTHRFRGSKKPESLEARVLFDADKLDSIGAVGIGRAFLFAGEVGAKLHNKGIDLAKTKPYTSEDTAYREFMVKLKKVKGRMLTAEGKFLAAERHSYMVGFFKRLDKEVSGVL